MDAPMEAPDACTLPTAEQPLRLAEFDALFARALRSVEVFGATRARMVFAGPEDLEDTVRDLAAREAACCSFFAFTVTPGRGGVALDIEVPPRYGDVLEALVQRGSTLGGCSSLTG
ncbi:hypothetical protein ACQP00_22355 [Dactylosporangium sp. CS-047395]|uniref:hypothetical protein n=1 Tax=Dactylosporangium sp. CS-047395 TaxID=3239936 RepID=UPI003D94A2F7